MKRRDLEQQARREQQRRWLLVGTALTLLAGALVVVGYRYFSGRAVLLRADQVETALTQSVDGLGQKQVDTARCPSRDLRRGETVVCDVSFTDGTSTRLRFGVKGRPGDVTPVISGA